MKKSKVILKLIALMILLTIVGTAIFYTKSNMNMRISVNDSKEKYNSGIDLTTATAQQVVTDMKAGWNLGNTLDSATDPKDSTIYAPSYYETAWSNPVTTKAMIDEVKAKGFNAVRIPVTWGANIEKGTQYTGTISSAWLDRVEEVVNYALDNNMYCIVNVHHDVGKGDWPIIFATADSTEKQTYNERLKNVWTQIATRFKDYDNRLIFEGFNEILIHNANWISANDAGDAAVKSINTYNQTFVDTVRKTGGNNANRFLSVNTYGAEVLDKAIDLFEVPTDTVKNHIMVQVHYYGILSQTICEKLNTKFISQGVPVIVGEFGWDIPSVGETEIANKAFAYVKLAKSYGMTCFWWDSGRINNNNVNYGILDRDSATFKYPKVAKAIIDAAENKTSSTYTELQNGYVQTSYAIDTKLKINSNCKYELKAGTTQEKYGTLINAYGTSDSTSIQLRLEGTVLASRYGVNTDKGIFTPTKEKPFVVVQDKGTYSVDGTAVKSYSDISPVLEPANTLKVGGLESRIYYLKVWDASGNLIGDFIPVLDSYGIACLYNKVTKEYCYSTGATKYYPTNEVSPESITLNKTEIRTEFKENIYSLVATLSPDNVNINDKITWTTSDDTIAQVFKGGDVVILGPKYGKAGECTITATTANGKTATCKVIVTNAGSSEVVDPESVSLSETTKTLDLNGTKEFTLTATITPSNANTSLTWASSKPDVATVTKGGKVTAVAKGTTTITVTTANGKTATCNVTVVNTETGDVLPESISLSETTKTLDLNGTKEFTLTATITPSNANTSLTWASSKPDVATVTKGGKVTAVAKGTTTITVTTANGKTATCNVTVVNTETGDVLPESISLSETTKTLDLNGTKEFTLTATIRPSNANKENTLTWTSSKPDVATVTKDGKVTAVAEGTTTITVKTANGKTATCTVTVTKSLVKNIVDIKYSTKDTTSNNVTVTITSNIKLKFKPGWTLSDDGYQISRDYTQNTKEQITVEDINGNTTTVDIVITNIKKNDDNTGNNDNSNNNNNGNNNSNSNNNNNGNNNSNSNNNNSGNNNSNSNNNNSGNNNSNSNNNNNGNNNSNSNNNNSGNNNSNSNNNNSGNNNSNNNNNSNSKNGSNNINYNNNNSNSGNGNQGTTTSGENLPKTGMNAIVTVAIVFVSGIVIALFIKLRKYKDVK